MDVHPNTTPPAQEGADEPLSPLHDASDELDRMLHDDSIEPSNFLPQPITEENIADLNNATFESPPTEGDDNDSVAAAVIGAPNSPTSSNPEGEKEAKLDLVGGDGDEAGEDGKDDDKEAVIGVSMSPTSTQVEDVEKVSDRVHGDKMDEGSDDVDDDQVGENENDEENGDGDDQVGENKKDDENDDDNRAVVGGPPVASSPNMNDEAYLKISLDGDSGHEVGEDNGKVRDDDEGSAPTCDTALESPLQATTSPPSETHPKLEATPQPSLLDNHDDTGITLGTGAQQVQRLTLDQEQQDQPQAPSTTSHQTNNEDDDSVSTTQSKSAQLLLGRWNSWRQKANVAWKQNTEKALKTEVGQRWAARAEAAKRDARDLFRAQQQQAASGRDAEGVAPQEDNINQDVMSNGTAAAKPVNGDTPVETVQEEDSAHLEDTVQEQDTGDDQQTAEGEGDGAAAVLSQEALERHGAASGDINATTIDDDERSTAIWTDSSAGDAYQRALTAAMAARTMVADSVVATGFRGRYNGGGSAAGDDGTPRRKGTGVSAGGPVSQTSLMLQSRAASHMQSILDDLDTSHEYVMLLGHGMLGVNLKQTYMKHHGVYIDYMLETGAAFASRVVHVGDTICQVGDNDVTRGTILDIPQTIAKARRPVVLVCSTGQAKNNDDDMSKVNHVDLAIAMMHQIRRRESERRATGISNMPLSDSNAATSSPPQLQQKGPVPFVEAEEDGVPTDNGEGTSNDEQLKQLSQGASTGLESWSLPDDYTLDATSNPANLPPIPMNAKQAVAEDLPKRGLGKFSLTTMIQAAKTMDNFAMTLKYAFIACALDGRKLPFLSAHFSSEDALDGTDDNDEDNEDYDEEDNNSQKSTASTQLMLFLELTSFVELFDVTPETRRRDVAKRIANKFFLPSKVGNRTEKPMFDFSYIVGPAELNGLIAAMANKKVPLRRNLFTPFQNAIVQSLSRAPFLTFLMSTECARMRGYLRGTSLYRTVAPGDILRIMLDKTEDDEAMANAHAHLIFIVCFLLCQHEREMGGENDDILVDKGDRLTSAANGLCCAVAIRKVLPGLEGAVSLESMKTSLEWLWQVFLAPRGGGLESGLSHSNETEKSLVAVRAFLQEASTISADSKRLKSALSEEKFKKALRCLADELIYDFTVNSYPKYREHKCHEWLCGEMLTREIQQTTNAAKEEKTTHFLPKLPSGAIHRLLRKLDFPSGLSPHKPIRQHPQEPNATEYGPRPKEGADLTKRTRSTENASVAIVFGSEDGTDAAAASNPALDHYEIRRYAECQLVDDDDGDKSSLKVPAVPPTLEGYATVPPMRRSPFGNVVDGARLSADGWQSTLVTFNIPGDAGSSLYGVSLVLSKDAGALREDHAVSVGKTELKVVVDNKQQQGDGVPPPAVDSPKGKDDGVEVVYDESSGPVDSGAFTSPLTFASPEASKRITDCSIRMSTETPVFSEKLEKSWTDRMVRHREQVEHITHVTVGIILLSSENVIQAMRETLTKLLLDFGRGADDKAGLLLRDRRCGALVDLLGNFSHSDVESKALKAILEPYLRFGARPWIERPVGTQKMEFDLLAGEQLVDSIPPTPLALLFVSLLLEQKVVFSSSQRSLLTSAVNGMLQLLEPVGWSHLVVPLVPSALAKDLLQYPAPFIVGIPSEDAGNIQLLSNLPRDVTLVDLDVGRVILAPTISYNDDVQQRQQGEDREATVRALRSQVLYLAQSLGAVFGNQLSPRTWKSDIVVADPCFQPPGTSSPFERLKVTCKSFLEELLDGSKACAYWMEAEDPTVVFDEDRFFQIKNLRAQGNHSPMLFQPPRPDALMLALDDFDLILECFLRGQGLSTYISSQPKQEMAFC